MIRNPLTDADSVIRLLAVTCAKSPDRIDALLSGLSGEALLVAQVYLKRSDESVLSKDALSLLKALHGQINTDERK